MDFSKTTFNKNHRLEAAAKDAATGVRLLVLAFVCAAVALVLAFLAERVRASSTILSLAGIVFAVTAFGAGAYGAYLAATALNWSGFVTAAIILGAIIPYLKFILFVVLAAFSMELVRKAGYQFSFFGPLKKRAAR